jgi:hypothetical protein
MWSPLVVFAAGLGPWLVLAGVGLFLAWTVLVVREFTRGQLVRSGRPFTVRLWGFSIAVGRAAGEPGPGEEP